MITHAQLLEAVHYEPETGIFTLLKDGPRRSVGAVLNTDFTMRPRQNYELVKRSSISLPGHGNFFTGRLAWFYMTGQWPTQEIDHRDNDGWNHQWINLREATRSQNNANRRTFKNNKSGRKCVFRTGSKRRPWRAQIQKDGSRISLGYFETEEAASAAVATASKALHGEYARFS